MPRLLPLADATTAAWMLRNRECVGGKAVGLARLAILGLPVPPGFVVPVAIFEEFLNASGLLDRAREVTADPDPEAVKALKAQVLRTPLPVVLADEIRLAAALLGPLLAVRSSAVDEDARRASFAGLYHTALGVSTVEELHVALRDCWASVFDVRVLCYCRKIGMKAHPAMAVVVQRLVAARTAGVVFTVNPHHGSSREMTVEAAWGLGEAVMGGHVVPDYYRIRRPRRLPGPVLGRRARMPLDVLEENVREQDERLVCGAGGVTWVPVPEADRLRRKLNRDQLSKLACLALRVEVESGSPEDLEWAIDQAGRIYFLQARPVTTSPGPHRPGDILWTRRFIGERWTSPATPLGWSLIAPLLEWFIAYPDTSSRHLGSGAALRLVGGVPYVNATVFRHLAFKLPGTPPPRFMMEMLPPDEERSFTGRFTASPDLWVYASILRETWREKRWERFRWNPLTNHQAWESLERRLARELPALERPVASSSEDALDRARKGMELAREYVKVHIASLLFANLLFQVTGNVIRLWAGARGEQLASEILTCPEENLTLTTNRDIWKLAQIGAASGAGLSEVPPPGTPFGDAFASCLSRHGYRSEATWEIMSPRWVERPERLLELLKRSVQTGTGDPRVRASERAALARAATQAIDHEVTGPVRRALLHRLVDLTRKYLLLRENQRYRFERLLFVVKRSYVVVGEDLAERGLLEHAEQIRFLTADEVVATLDGALDEKLVRDTVARRTAEMEAWEASCPPDFLLGDEALPPPVPGSRRLVGLGTSPGVARGRVHVLRHADDSLRLRGGEILVARAIEPGQTPLLLLARGLVLELGSQLSHSAVIAREYRLPAVVNVRSATQILADDAEVTIDGTRGLIWVHD
jgi:rifampicin phosphotransferase